MEVVWSNDQISLLIELYQQHKILWDASNKAYKYKFKKNDAWADIAAQLNISQKEVETKMHILRSQFSREKKKQKLSKRTGSDTEEVFKSKWQWYEPLQFLLCGATTSTSGTSDKMRTDGSSSTQPSNAPLSVPPPRPPSPRLPTLPPPRLPPTPPPLSHSNKRKCDESLSEAYEIMRIAKKKMEEPKDEFEIYGQYVASELRNVKNTRALIQAKYYINKILLQARMGHFDGGYGYGDGFRDYGDEYRTPSSTSTYVDASPPTHHTATGDELHFNSTEEILVVSKFEDDTQ